MYSQSDSNPNDASLDVDGDFLSNLSEYLAGTSPVSGDSDADGLSDLYDQGLDCYWRFSDSTGSPASTSNALAGRPALTLNGATIDSGGLFGSSLKPTSYDQSVQAAASVLSGAMEWSFSGWFKMDNYQSNNVIFALKYNSSSTNLIGAHLAASGWGSMTLYVTVNGNTYSGTVSIASGSGYHHLAVCRNQTTNRAEAYFDGSLVISAPVSSSPEPLNVTSGQFKVSTSPVTGSPGTNDYLYGNIDDVRLYKRRLQAAEVDALYEQGCTSGNAAKYWTLAWLLNNSLGQADADSDGFTNLAEVIAGSDPQSSSSKPVPASTGYQLHTRLN